MFGWVTQFYVRISRNFLCDKLQKHTEGSVETTNKILSITSFPRVFSFNHEKVLLSTELRATINDNIVIEYWYQYLKVCLDNLYKIERVS